MVSAPVSVSLLIKLQTIKADHPVAASEFFHPLPPVCFPLITQKRPQDCNVIKKETLAQVFSCEFGEIFKNTFFKEHLRLLLMESMFFISRLYQSTLGHMGKSIQEWTKPILLETAFKKFEGVWSP